MIPGGILILWYQGHEESMMMRKSVVLSLVVLGVVLAGCSNPSNETEADPRLSFQGNWRRYGMNSRGQIYEDFLVFTDSNFVFTYNRPDDGKGTFSGPFSYTKNTITFNPTEGIDEDEKDLIPWTQNYEIYINEFDQTVLDIEFKPIVEGVSFYLLYGIFIKQ